MLKKMKKNKIKIISILIIMLLIILLVFSKMYNKNNNMQVANENIEMINEKQQVLEELITKKADEIINIEKCSDKFMNNYFEEMSNIKTEEEENILIVTALNKINNDYGATKVISGPNNQYFLQYATEEEKNNALEELSNSQEILYVGENIIYTACDSDYNSWGIEKMGLDKAIKVSESNELEEITVAIIDTGCSVSLIKNNYPEKIKGTYNVLTAGTDVTDSSGHGTHIAGTIAEGTPNNVKIFPIRASLANEPTKFSTTDLITAINYVVYNQKAQVINMSFGSATYDNNMFVAISAAYKNNIISVAAAGNESTSDSHYPSGYSNTISISAVDSDFSLADYSNYGETITFSAPGTNIYSVNGTKSGTSMATPHAVNAVAILKSFHPEYTMEQVVEELKKHTIDLGTDGWDEQFGYGFIYFDVDSLSELNEGDIFKDNIINGCVKKIETPDFVAVENYGTISNILEAQINIYYNDTDYLTKALWELENLEILNYEPYNYNIQNVTIRYSGQECILSVDNRNNTRSVWKYEIIDNEKGYISITNWNPQGIVKLKKLYMPSELDGYTVKKIGEKIFKDNTIFSYYYLPESIEVIGKGAFTNSLIVGLDSEAAEISVDEEAFYGCKELKKFNGKISSIGSLAFSNNDLLEEIIFSNNIEVISQAAFQHCKNLKDLELPNSVNTIEDYAFLGCDKIENIHISKNVIAIGKKAFGCIDNLKNISIDNENSVYDSRNDCNAIIETETNTLIQGAIDTVVPDSVKVIGSSSFEEVRIKEIIIPEGVETINEKAFYHGIFDDLEKVVLPRTVTFIDSTAFRETLAPKVVVWVYQDSYAESFIQNTSFKYLYRDTNIYDIDVALTKTNYHAFEKIGINDISISLVYYNGEMTYQPYYGDVYLTYMNNDNCLSHLDEYIIIGVLDGNRKVSKNVPINVSRLLPEYEVPQNLTGKTNTLLSSILLPDNFEWMNPNQKITQIGNQTFNAKYIPSDSNYEIIENINVNVMISQGKELIVPDISIGDKVYDGTTNVDINTITISNLNENEYIIENVFLLSPEAGEQKVSVELKLTDEKFEEFTFDNGKAKKTFVENIKINNPKEVIIPNILIKDKIYDGTTEIDVLDVDIYNLETTEYSIISAISSSADAGERTATIKIKLSNEKFENYSFDNGKQEKEFEVLFNIIPKKIKKPEQPSSSYNYSGEEIIFEITEYDENAMIISGNKGIDAGQYEVIVSLKNTNYVWDDGSTNSIILNFEILKAKLNVIDSSTNVTVKYDGTPHNVNISLEYNEGTILKYMDENNEYTLDDVPQYIEVGTYVTRYKLYLDNNHTEYFGERILTITENTIPNNSSDYEGIYDGNEHSITIDIEVPEYSIKYSINNTNYDLTELPMFKEVGEYTVNYKITAEGYDDLIGSNKVKIYGIKNVDNTMILKDNVLLITNYNNEFTNICNNITVFAKSYEIQHIDKNGEIVIDELIKTGEKIRVNINGQTDIEYTLAILGDINGDGKINIKDWNRMYDHINETSILTDYNLLCGDINRDGKVNIKDWNRMYDHITEVNPLW